MRDSSQPMRPRFETLAPTTLAGYRRSMSLLADNTTELWRSFQQRLLALGCPPDTVRYSIQCYQPDYFAAFDPARYFEKWAAVALLPDQSPPPDADLLVLPGGLYAVFDYRGPVSAAAQVFEGIFTTWLPVSGYVLDERPHFEVLGERFDRDAPNSEEEIWVPVRPVAA